MKNIIFRNILLKIFCFFLAFGIWYYVIITQNPEVVRNFPVRLQVKNLAQELKVDNLPKEIKVKVKGKRLTLLQKFKMHSKPVQVFVDLSNASPGIRAWEVKFTKPASADFEIISLDPEIVSLNIVKFVNKDMLVEFSLLGKPAPNYLREEISLTPEVVRVYGPEEIINKLARASVTIDISKAKKDINRELRVKLLDKNLEELNGLNAEPSHIKVKVGIVKLSRKEVVLITPELKGNPKKGFKIARVTLEPDKLKIEGKFDIIKNIEEIKLEPVNIEGIDHNLKIPVRAVIPVDGISVLGSNIVNVTIQVEKILVRKRVRGVPVTLSNRKKTLKYRIFPENIDFFIQGPESSLSGFTGSNMKFNLDVSEKDAGSYTVVPHLQFTGEAAFTVEAIPEVQLIVEKELTEEIKEDE